MSAKRDPKAQVIEYFLSISHEEAIGLLVTIRDLLRKPRAVPKEKAKPVEVKMARP